MGFFTGPLTTWKLAFKEVSEERRKRETEPAKQKSWSFVTLSQKKEKKKKREREIPSLCRIHQVQPTFKLWG